MKYFGEKAGIFSQSLDDLPDGVRLLLGQRRLPGVTAGEVFRQVDLVFGADLGLHRELRGTAANVVAGIVQIFQNGRQRNGVAAGERVGASVQRYGDGGAPTGAVLCAVGAFGFICGGMVIVRTVCLRLAESGSGVLPVGRFGDEHLELIHCRGGLGGTLGAKETGEHGTCQQHYRETSGHGRPALPMHLRLLGLSAQGVRFGDQIGGKQTQRVMKLFGSHTLKPSFSKYSFSPTRVR